MTFITLHLIGVINHSGIHCIHFGHRVEIYFMFGMVTLHRVN